MLIRSQSSEDIEALVVDDDVPELDELIHAVLLAVAGWGPDEAVGVFELARGSLIHNRDGVLVYQLDFAIDDQLRIP